MNVGCWASVVLFLLSGVALIVTVVLPAADALESIPGLTPLLQTLLCSPDETLDVEPVSTGMRGFGTVFSADLSCVNPSGAQRSVTDSLTLIGIGAFLIPFFLGMFALMKGTAKPSQNQVTSTNDPIKRTVTVTSIATPARDTLTTRLAELEDAYRNQQITEEEHQTMRQKLLEQFTRDVR